MSAANRRRGHDTERAVVKYLREQGWPDACTTRAKLGHDGATAPGDIDFHPLICLEVKDVASSAWPSWCRQAAGEARPGMVPVVVRRVRGVPDVGAWPVRVDWHAAAAAFGAHIALESLVPRGVHAVDADLWVESTMGELVAAVKAVDA